MENRYFVLIWFVALLIVLRSRESPSSKRKRELEFEKVQQWLKINFPGSEKPKDAFLNAGILNLGHLSLLSTDEFMFLSKSHYWSSADTLSLKSALHELKMVLVFKNWLKRFEMEDLYLTLSSHGINTLEKLSNNLNFNTASIVFGNEMGKLRQFWSAVKILKASKHQGFDDYPVGVEVSVLKKILWFFWELVVIVAKIYVYMSMLGFVLISILSFLLRWLVTGIFNFIRENSNGRLSPTLQNLLEPTQRPARPNPFRLPQPRIPLPQPEPGFGIFGNIFNAFFRNGAAETPLPFSARQTKFKFMWEENNAVVGEMRSFSVTFYKNFFFVCRARDVPNARARITVNNEEIPCTVEMDDSNKFIVKFTPLISGSYKICFTAAGKLIDTHHKTFLPGVMDPAKTSLRVARSTIVMRADEVSEMVLDERDKYGNQCNVADDVSLSKYRFDVKQMREDLTPVTPDIRVAQQPSRLAISMLFSDPDCYQITISYDGKPILKNVITAIVLCEEKWNKIKSDVKRQSWNLWYEAYLIPDDDDDSKQSRRKVYCYITSKVLTIKEYYLKIFPKRLHTLRMRPSTKLSLLQRKHSESGYMVMRIEESSGNSILLACKERDLFAATFTQMLIGNLGGFDSFENKRNHLYTELRKIYSKKSKLKSNMSVHRETLLHDAMKLTKNFSDGDWGKSFSIEFIGEAGLDYGGLRREFFQMLCDSLFKPKARLFQKVGKDDAQSMVHPNPHRPDELKKLKYFEFAGKIVGKILIDCAHDRQQYIRARFSRSFLAQIMGLGVSWRHFETDDKDFYKTKIKYILKNDVEDLDLTFSEEVYDENQTLMKVVDLKPNGSQIAVTDKNKMNYLQLVAEYRLVNSVKDEISAFLKGLNSLVPDSLLSMFDENELELLICGTENISIQDLQQNFTKLYGGGPNFDKVLSWFWETLSAFNQEELSRLVQFTTGCSQLPPGGFRDLSPPFQIMAYHGTNALPSAHTCFNMLCLPNYTNKEELRRLLLIALNEGSEGFGIV